VKDPYERIKETYSSKYHRIREFFDRDSFEPVSRDSIPQDYINDCALALGMEYVIERRGLLEDKDKTFFVINAGAPHLPLIACFLKSHDIEPYFYIKGSAPSCTTSFLYFEKAFKSIDISENSGMAQLFDAHAEFDKVSVMPAVTKLKKLGISKAVIMVEYNFQPLNHTYRKHPEFGKRVAKYRKKRINTEIIEIDPRPREKDFDRIIDMLKEKDEILAKLSEYLKTDKKEALKVIKNGKKAFFD
jgi:hypothetical protein